MLTPIGAAHQQRYAHGHGTNPARKRVKDMAETPRLIIGISGASGVTYGVRLLEMLRDLAVETHLVMTRAAEVTLAHETGFKVAEEQELAHRSYASTDIAA